MGRYAIEMYENLRESVEVRVRESLEGDAYCYSRESEDMLLDSLAAFEMIMGLEQKFGIEIEDKDADVIKNGRGGEIRTDVFNVKGLVDYLVCRDEVA